MWRRGQYAHFPNLILHLGQSEILSLGGEVLKKFNLQIVPLKSWEFQSMLVSRFVCLFVCLLVHSRLQFFSYDSHFFITLSFARVEHSQIWAQSVQF